MTELCHNLLIKISHFHFISTLTSQFFVILYNIKSVSVTMKPNLKWHITLCVTIYIIHGFVQKIHSSFLLSQNRLTSINAQTLVESLVNLFFFYKIKLIIQKDNPPPNVFSPPIFIKGANNSGANCIQYQPPVYQSWECQMLNCGCSRLNK